MRSNLALRSLLGFLAIAVCQGAIAAEKLGKEQTTRLIAGNTAEGKNAKWNKGGMWYFDKLGTIDGGELVWKFDKVVEGNPHGL